NTIHQQIIVWNELFASQVINQDHEYDNLPFIGGLVGFFSYDLGKQLEFIAKNSDRIIPDYIFGLYNQSFVFDLINKYVYIIVISLNNFEYDYKAQLSVLERIYENANSDCQINTMNYLPKIIVTPNFTQEQYVDIVERGIKYISDGDIFEVNLAQCFKAVVNKDYPCELLYHKLRQTNIAPFSAYLNFGSLCIMSASPERFLSIKNRQVEARPIKGTIKRSLDPDEDLQLAIQLSISDKDRAENIMIVDLMRNDLSKICKKETVIVSQLCGVESYTNIHHLVSVINGELKDDTSIFTIIPSCFPGGSITGAPKIRAMQIIDELEPENRGVYCGSIGYFSFNGNVDLSIAIRTIIKNGTDLRYYAGGAITLDSEPIKEYNETLLKAYKLQEIFQ
ncbi:MAG: aminodeoxychorismate synthase component I, partial [Burkholderiales bacterium]|nr:aminodeoxychorismate synthase component I [Burkholderiales bacterium]